MKGDTPVVSHAHTSHFLSEPTAEASLMMPSFVAFRRINNVLCRYFRRGHPNKSLYMYITIYYT